MGLNIKNLWTTVKSPFLLSLVKAEAQKAFCKKMNRKVIFQIENLESTSLFLASISGFYKPLLD